MVQLLEEWILGTLDEMRKNDQKFRKRRDKRQHFSIPIMNDNVKEGAESFSISITAKGAKIASGSFTKTITIVDDESPFYFNLCT